ncbi:hypothetical protein Btru_034844 [Bulinus truncatus]|nr:hypothetical protein Btru_034844 [Bulinus truncatus]
MHIRIIFEINLYTRLEEYDLCNPDNLDITSSLEAINIHAISTEVFVNFTYEESLNSLNVCRLSFKTLPMCRIQLKLVDINFGSKSCNSAVINYDPSTCLYSCHYLSVYDTVYPKRNTVFTNTYSSTVFTSESSQISIVGCFQRMNAGSAVSIKLIVTSEAKIQTIRGNSDSVKDPNFIYSPNYPNQYALNDDVYMYRIQSTLKTDIITVLFDDWFVSPSSFLLAREGDSIQLRYIASDHPYIISNGPEINLTFYPGYQLQNSDFSDHVFKAVVTFYKDCGGLMSADGVVLSNSITDGLRDCIWVIKKDATFDGVLLNFPKYKAAENYFNRMEVRNGLTSDQKLLKPTNGPNSWSSGLSNVYYSEVGFYIRLQGRFNAGDSMLFSYAMYLNDCFDSGNFFKCDNGFCIQLVLRCDGYDHCGDKSDESSYLCRSYSTGNDGGGSTSSLSIGIIVPMVVSVFLVIVICLLIIFIRRCRRLNNSAFGNQPNVSAQQQNRGNRRRRHNVQMSVTVSSGDHPPSYEEVIQNTPIGYLNMAFTWTPGDHGADPGLAQPPSYEESILPTSTTVTSQSTPTAATSTTLLSRTNNMLLHSTTNLSTPLHQGAGVTRASLFASLDPGAYVSSSSSSSEGASDQDNPLNTSSSSYSSTEMGNGLFPTGAQRAGSNVISKNDMQVTLAPKSRNSEAKPESDETCVQLSSVAFTKEKNGINRKLSKSMNHLDQIARDVGVHDSSNYNNLTSTKPEESAMPADKRSSQNVIREGMYVKKPLQKISKHFATQDSVQLQGITDYSRSHSCVDLSLGGAVGGGLQDEDKRFSYAGCGDVSLRKGNFDPYLMGRGLVRDKPIENLTKYSAASCDNLSGGYRRVKNADNPEQEKKLLSGQDTLHPKCSMQSYASASSLSRFSDADASLVSAADSFSRCRPKTKPESVPAHGDDHPIFNNAECGQTQHTRSRPQHQHPDNQGRAHQSYAPSSNEKPRTGHDKYTAVDHRKRIHSLGQNLTNLDQPRVDKNYRIPDHQSDSQRSQQIDRQNTTPHNQQEDRILKTNMGQSHQEPIYQTPRPISEKSNQSSRETDHRGEVQTVSKPHQQEHIYQTPRQRTDPPPDRRRSEPIYQNPHLNTEITTSASDRNISCNISRKPIPTPRQGVIKMHKPTDRPIPVARSTSRKQGSSNNPSVPPSLTSTSNHPYQAQSSGYAADLLQAPGRLTGSQACDSQAGESHDSSRGKTVLTLDPSVFNSKDKDVFV